VIRLYVCAVAARGENGREGCEFPSLVEHLGFLPWLFLIISGVSSHSSGPNPNNIILFSCFFTSVSLDLLCTYLQAMVNNLFATAALKRLLSLITAGSEFKIFIFLQCFCCASTCLCLAIFLNPSSYSRQDTSSYACTVA